MHKQAIRALAGVAIMKLWMEIDYEIDGKITPEQLEHAALSLVHSSVITSEDQGDGDAYAVLINSTTLHMEKPK